MPRRCALIAASHEAGRAELFLTKEWLQSTGSSLYRENTAFFRDEVVVKQQVDKVRIDDLFKGRRFDFVKIDTQGYEKQVLEGGRRVMSMLKGVLMELPIIHLYQGTWHLHEAIDFMRQSGFIPAQIYPVNYHVSDPQSLLEVDCLFRQRDKRLDSVGVPERGDA